MRARVREVETCSISSTNTYHTHLCSDVRITLSPAHPTIQLSLYSYADSRTCAWITVSNRLRCRVTGTRTRGVVSEVVERSTVQSLGKRAHACGKSGTQHDANYTARLTSSMLRIGSSQTTLDCLYASISSAVTRPAAKRAHIRRAWLRVVG